MLNVVPHIFSFINFCVRTLIFFFNRRKPYFSKVRNQSIFYNQLSVFVNIFYYNLFIITCFNFNYLIYFEILESKTAVRLEIYLTALERIDTVARYIDRSQEKERCTHVENTRFDRVATSFLPTRPRAPSVMESGASIAERGVSSYHETMLKNKSKLTRNNGFCVF